MKRSLLTLAFLLLSSAPALSQTPGYTVSVIRDGAASTSTASVYLQIAGGYEAGFTATASTDLGAELQALLEAKKEMRRLIALCDAIALEHIGEALP